jgi:hypothetical protein
MGGGFGFGISVVVGDDPRDVKIEAHGTNPKAPAANSRDLLPPREPPPPYTGPKFTIEMPILPARDGVGLAEFLNDNLPEVSAGIRQGFAQVFDGYVSTHLLKRYKDRSQDSYFCDRPRPSFDATIFKVLSGEIEPRHAPPLAITYVAFDLVFAKSNVSHIPDGDFQGGEPAPFIVIQPPWEIVLHWADKKEQVTQVRFRFRAFIHLRLSTDPQWMGRGHT